MKATNITYWISTSLTSALFAFSSVLYLTHNPQLVNGLKILGYPEYLLNILGLAKILAAIALIVPGFHKLKEWAYAGLVINLIGAIWSHIAAGDGAHATSVLLPFVLLSVSYLTYQKRQENLQHANETNNHFKTIPAKN